MTEAFVSINGTRVTELELRVANVGPWFAELDLESEVDLAGAVTLKIGEREFRGTVDPTAIGTFGLRTKLRLIGGGGAWAKTVKRKPYHNDAGVKASLVAQDLAREVGETLGSFVPTRERLGNDYARGEGLAATILEDVINGAPWWVDYDGVTQVGPRPSTAAAAGSYEILAYDPKSHMATLHVDDVAAVRIGTILSERLDGPQTVRELALRVTENELRIMAWCGGGELAGGMLADLMRAIVRRSIDGVLYGCYRYRVLELAGDRLQLQAVSAAAGLPDLGPISMWPGLAGVHAQLTPGTEVLVEFIEGDRAQPIVTHFSGKDGKGFVPASIVIGGASGQNAAREGDTVEVLLPPALLSGTAIISGVPSPITGALTFMVGKALGQITSGSSKVKVAT